MSAVKCHWCIALATGTVRAAPDRAKGLPGVVLPHCDTHWEDAYRVVKVYPARTWKMIEQPEALF